MLNTFRWIGYLEGVSFLILLFVGVPLKYVGGHPELVKIMGPIHGTLFLVYILLANWAAEHLNWTMRIRVYSWIASILPFGTFVFEKKYLPKTANKPT